MRRIVKGLSSTWNRSNAVVGMAGQDGDGAIELFCDQRADELVRPGHFAQAECSVGTIVERGIEAVGAADRDHQIAFALVAIGAEQICESFAVERLAAFIEKNEDAAFGKRFQQYRCLLAFAGLCIGGAAFGSFGNTGKFEADRRAGLGETIKITGRKILFGAGFQPSHRKKTNSHSPAPAYQASATRKARLPAGLDVSRPVNATLRYRSNAGPPACQCRVSSSMSGAAHIFSML
ncbi:hypothetical protein RHECNPAF_33400106 [Rhizobium etli CNPAF512]|nr:hypothetical protein RHECNPAF_33400106 [Rhizobium etli CNPAF512]